MPLQVLFFMTLLPCKLAVGPSEKRQRPQWTDRGRAGTKYVFFCIVVWFMSVLWHGADFRFDDGHEERAGHLTPVTKPGLGTSGCLTIRYTSHDDDNPLIHPYCDSPYISHVVSILAVYSTYIFFLPFLTLLTFCFTAVFMCTVSFFPVLCLNLCHLCLWCHCPLHLHWH